MSDTRQFDPSRSTVLTAITDEYVQMIDEAERQVIHDEDLNPVVRTAGRVLGMATARGDTHTMGRAEAVLALAHQYHGQIGDALRHADSAIDLLDQASDWARLTFVLVRAAADYARISDTTEALRLIERAQRLIDLTPETDLDTRYRWWVNLSVVMEEMGHWPDALDAAENGVRIAALLDDPAKLVHAQAAVANHRFNLIALKAGTGGTEVQDELQLLLGELSRIEQVCAAQNMGVLIPDLYIAAGHVHVLIGDQAAARRFLTRAAESTKASMSRDHRLALYRLAVLDHAEGDHESARALLREVMETSTELRDDKLLAECHLEMSLMAQAEGDHESALTHYHTYHRLTMAKVHSRNETLAQVTAERMKKERARLDEKVHALQNQRMLRDLQAAASERDSFAVDAATDALTRLGNRRAFDDAVGALQPGMWYTIMIADLDHFKKVNDTYGHAVGDEVLTAIADLLRGSIRVGRDAVFRFGGEEFVILASHATQSDQMHGAAWFADRIRQHIGAHDWSALTPDHAVTVSIGVCPVTHSAMDGKGGVSDALALADGALYSAKNSGRNRVHVHRNTPPS